MTRFIAVYRDKLIANLWSILGIVHCAKLRLVCLVLYVVILNTISQLFIIGICIVKCSTVVLRFLLPSVNVQTIMEHQYELDHLIVEDWVDILTALTKIQTENLIG